LCKEKKEIFISVFVLILTCNLKFKN